MRILIIPSVKFRRICVSGRRCSAGSSPPGQGVEEEGGRGVGGPPHQPGHQRDEDGHQARGEEPNDRVEGRGHSVQVGQVTAEREERIKCKPI